MSASKPLAIGLDRFLSLIESLPSKSATFFSQKNQIEQLFGVLLQRHNKILTTRVGKGDVNPPNYFTYHSWYMPTWLYFCCIIVYIPGQGVCIQVLLSRLCPLQTFPGLHVRVLVCKLFPQVAPQGPNGVHWVKFSSPFPSTAFLAASMDDLYSSFSRRCSISEKKN